MNGDGYPRETQEPVIFDEVTVDGVPTLAFVYQLTRKGERPDMAVPAWSTPLDFGGEAGFQLQPVGSRGTYSVWVKIAQGGNNYVIEAGEIERT